jgi:hypothetical protein
MKKYLFALILCIPLIATSQNKVGINTDSPQAKLDIQGTGITGDTLLRFSTDRPWIFKQLDSGINTRLSLQSTINDKKFEILSEDGLNRAAEFHSNNAYSRVMLVPDAGEVGIGVNDANSKLHISANSGLSFAHLRLTEEGPDYARIKMESDTDPGAYWDIAGRADSVLEDSRLNFFFSSPNGFGDRMTIRGNGRIGINNTNPEAKLDITGGNWNLEAGEPGDLRIGTATHNLRIGVATGGGGAGIARIFAGGGANTLFFGTNDERRMVITSGGNIGIGTDNPGNKLRVNGSPSSTQHVFSASSNYSGNVHIRSIEGFSLPADGYGYGGYFEGGYGGTIGIARGGNYTGTVYGVQGHATGAGVGTRVGTYGTATGGTTNWAGYFDNGNVYMRNDLRIGSGAIAGAAGYKVAIDGKMIVEEVRVKLSQNWPDYVFASDYDLTPLDEVEMHIQEHQHLPGIPSAAQVETEGQLVGQMQVKMMEKIEELTLYIIDLNKRLEGVEKENQLLKNQLHPK